jgi:cytochrome c biogenesis protein CcdA
MLPIYVSYFAGGGERTTAKTLKGALGFVTGFTAIFVILGAFAGTVGSFLREYQTVVNLVSGLVVIFFGLNFLGVFKLNLFKGSNWSPKAENLIPIPLRRIDFRANFRYNFFNMDLYGLFCHAAADHGTAILAGRTGGNVD